jgi:hypothetical protein
MVLQQIAPETFAINFVALLLFVPLADTHGIEVFSIHWKLISLPSTDEHGMMPVAIRIDWPSVIFSVTDRAPACRSWNWNFFPAKYAMFMAHLALLRLLQTHLSVYAS